MPLGGHLRAHYPTQNENMGGHVAKAYLRVPSKLWQVFVLDDFGLVRLRWRWSHGHREHIYIIMSP